MAFSYFIDMPIDAETNGETVYVVSNERAIPRVNLINWIGFNFPSKDFQDFNISQEVSQANLNSYNARRDAGGSQRRTGPNTYVDMTAADWVTAMTVAVPGWFVE